MQCLCCPDCGDKPADIVFVLDSSASEGSANFRKQIDFVSNLTVHLNIGRDEAQVMMMLVTIVAVVIIVTMMTLVMVGVPLMMVVMAVIVAVVVAMIVW